MGTSALRRFVSASPVVSTESFDDVDAKPVTIEDTIEGTVESVTTDLQKSEIEVADVENDVQEIEATATAMEHYHTLLTESLSDGGLSAQSAKLFAVGMEHFRIKTGMQIGVSVEDFGGTMSRKEATRVSIEGLNDTLRKIWEAGKNALRALYQLLKDFAVKVTNGVTKLEEQVAALSGKAKSISGAPAQAEITLKNPGKLVINGDVTKDLTALKGIADYVYNGYRSNTLVFIKNLTKAVVDMGDGKIESGIAKSLIANSPYSWFTQGAKVTGDERFDSSLKVVRTPVSNGNMALYMAGPEAPSDFSSDASEVLSLVQQFEIKLLDVKEAKDYSGEAQVQVGKQSDITRRLDVISKILESVKSSQDMASQVQGAFEDLEKAADGYVAKAQGDEAARTDEVRAMARAVDKARNMAGASFQGVLSYIVRTCGAHLALIGQEIAAYGQAEKAAA